MTTLGAFGVSFLPASIFLKSRTFNLLLFFLPRGKIKIYGKSIENNHHCGFPSALPKQSKQNKFCCGICREYKPVLRNWKEIEFLSYSRSADTWSLETFLPGINDLVGSCSMPFLSSLNFQTKQFRYAHSGSLLSTIGGKGHVYVYLGVMPLWGQSKEWL